MGFIVYVGICYVVHWLEQNYTMLWLIFNNEENI